MRFESTNLEELCGSMVTVEELIEDVIRDEDFYIESGGGVTLSGGEAMLQADGIRLLAKALHDRGISVIIDTAGCVPYSEFEKVNPYIDCYYYDWKSCNEKDYANVIGGNYSLIWNNLRQLIEDGKKVRVRVPLIPGFNTSGPYSERMCTCLKQAGVTSVDLLPFHRLGAGKYHALGLTYAYQQTPPLSIHIAEHISCIYRKYFDTTIEK